MKYYSWIKTKRSKTKKLGCFRIKSVKFLKKNSTKPNRHFVLQQQNVL